jgi:8-amino-7-oxononanoate synthase
LNLQERISKELETRNQKGALRKLSAHTFAIDFCSNDYLGLAKSVSSVTNETSGSGGSRLISGNYKAIETFESKLAEHNEKESALVFSTGYSANVGFFSSLPKRGDVILYDELVHASIRDGIRLSYANSFSFLHNDLEDLKRKLEKYKDKIVFVAIESVYSMDGDSPDFEKLKNLKSLFEFHLVVDEAHTFGLFGNQGIGLVQYLGFQDIADTIVVTFGKAMGCDGAAVLGSELIKNYLINYSRPFIYSTAPSPHKVALMQQQLENLKKVTDRNQNAQRLKALFLEKISDHFECIMGEYGNIVGVMIKGNEKTQKVAQNLQDNGVFCKSDFVANSKRRI